MDILAVAQAVEQAYYDATLGGYVAELDAELRAAVNRGSTAAKHAND